MNTNAVHGASTTRTTSDFTQMVGDLRRKADANRDGSVSTAEFAHFLDELVAADSHKSKSAAASANSEPAPAPTAVKKG